MDKENFKKAGELLKRIEGLHSRISGMEGMKGLKVDPRYELFLSRPGTSKQEKVDKNTALKVAEFHIDSLRDELKKLQLQFEEL